MALILLGRSLYSFRYGDRTIGGGGVGVGKTIELRRRRRRRENNRMEKEEEEEEGNNRIEEEEEEEEGGKQ